MRLKCISLVAVSLLLAGAALADKSDFKIGEDGSVEVKGQYYGDMLEFQLSEQFKRGGHRCASQDLTALEERILLAQPSDCSFSSTTIQSEYDPSNGDTYTIPVVFHIISRTNGTGNIANTLITSQVDILNEDFRALAGTPGGPGTDTKIQFVLASTDPNGNATSGINRVTSNAYFTDPGPGAFNDMKQALRWDTTRYLNIYTNDAAGNLGYATFPQQDAGSVNDGVVLLYSSVGRNSPGGGIYNQGRTATHEVGHYLGLFHTFQSGCGSASSPFTTGDLLADTERQSAPNYNCPNASSCSSRDPIENYMNYTQDTCMDRFTGQQTNRMRCSLINYRSTLVGGTGGPGGGAPCTNCEQYSGNLTGTGDADAQPNGTWYFSAAGTHQGWLEGPGSADFDLELYRWTGRWTRVAQSVSSTSSEQITYNGARGYYYWRVVSYSGSGSYDFYLDRP
ncbi:MAG: zinc metalloprotease [Acidobacteriota bacterium]